MIVFGEVTTKAKIDYQKTVRDVVKKIGYDDSIKVFPFCLSFFDPPPQIFLQGLIMKLAVFLLQLESSLKTLPKECTKTKRKKMLELVIRYSLPLQSWASYIVLL